MPSVLRMGSNSTLKNVTLPSDVTILIGSDSQNVVIEGVKSSGNNTDRIEIHYGENLKNVKVDGKKVH